MSDKAAKSLREFVANGGSLLITGPDVFKRFDTDFFGANSIANEERVSYYVPLPQAALRVTSAWRLLKPAKARVVGTLGSTALTDAELTPYPAAVLNKMGQGKVLYVPFNLFQACADLGIRRVIWASSNHAYGVRGAPPVYVPIDEAHPLRPADAYALSKVVGEQTADYFVARHGLEILSFRFMGVREPSALDAEVERIARAPGEGVHLLWTRADARDAALACRLAVEAKDVEPGPYNITGRQVVLEEDSATLVRRYFGDQVEIREGLAGRTSPLSCKRAEEAFGYRPRYDWTVNQRHPEEDAS